MEDFNDMHVNAGNNEESDATLSDKHDIDADDDGDEENGGDGTEPEPADRRDEVGEVRKMSSKDTNRLRLWRIIVTCVLLLTAFAVTFTTYTLLKQQEDENFKTAVSHVGFDWPSIGHQSIFHSLTDRMSL